MHTRVLSHFSCVQFCNPMDWPPGSSVLGILQVGILKWLPFPSPRDLPDPKIEPVSLMSPALTGGFFTASATFKSSRVEYRWCFYSLNLGIVKSNNCLCIQLLNNFSHLWSLWSVTQLIGKKKLSTIFLKNKISKLYFQHIVLTLLSWEEKNLISFYLV